MGTVEMSGRNGLTWVTALTIASLLLGAGALNALAEGHGGGDHGGGSGRANAAHQQQSPAVVNQANHEGEGGSNTNHQATVHDTKQAPAQDQAKENDDSHKGNNNNVERKSDENEDLVTKPDRVTDNARPCRDDDDKHCNNGNDDNHSNNNNYDEGERGVSNDDASTATVATTDTSDATDN
jgi:hypothetical protein